MSNRKLHLLWIPALITAAILINGPLPGVSATRIRGTIVHVDTKNETVQLKQNGRLLRLKANRGICDANKGNLNKRVVVNYDRLRDGTLVVRKIELITVNMSRNKMK